MFIFQKEKLLKVKENIEIWLSDEEASKLFNKTPATIRQYAKLKKIVSKQFKRGDGRGRPGKLYSYNSLVSMYGEPGDLKKVQSILLNGRLKGKNKPPEIKENIEKLIEDVPDSTSIDNSTSVEIIKDRKLSKAEAERLYKLEQAIAKQRENLIKDGQLIYVSDIKEDLEEILASVWEELREKIDKWGIDFNFNPSDVKNMHIEFNSVLINVKDKIISRIKFESENRA